MILTHCTCQENKKKEKDSFKVAPMNRYNDKITTSKNR